MTETSTETTKRRFTMLAVDDERANLNLLRRTFRKDYDLHLADNGEAGLSILSENPVDMIITDQRMPKLTGVQMLEKSRAIVPDAVRIVLTAYSDVQDIIDAVNKGHIYRYVLKPWSPNELKLTVSTALEHYSVQNENRELVIQLRQSLEELKAAQQELLNTERLSTLGKMASTIIHDLKLPMTNIKSSAALLGRGNLTPELRTEFSGIISKEVDRLIDMTREILDFSRGKLKIIREEFELDGLFEEIIKMIEPDLTKSRVDIDKRWETLGTVVGDRERLRRVFLNLITNACDAMSGGGRLTVEAGRESNRIDINILDTGQGIPEEILDTIFTPFITHGKHNGTGLGMTIARNIIEAHNGTITINNRLEGGAAVEIMLPTSLDG